MLREVLADDAVEAARLAGDARPVLGVGVDPDQRELANVEAELLRLHAGVGPQDHAPIHTCVYIYIYICIQIIILILILILIIIM